MVKSREILTKFVALSWNFVIIPYMLTGVIINNTKLKSAYMQMPKKCITKICTHLFFCVCCTFFGLVTLALPVVEKMIAFLLPRIFSRKILVLCNVLNWIFIKSMLLFSCSLFHTMIIFMHKLITNPKLFKVTLVTAGSVVIPFAPVNIS
jgi:hypothetical protein